MAIVYKRGTAGNPSPIPNVPPKPGLTAPPSPPAAPALTPVLPSHGSHRGWWLGAVLLLCFLLLVMVRARLAASDPVSNEQNPAGSSSVSANSYQGLSSNPRERALQEEAMGNMEANRIMSEERHERIQSYIRRHEYEWFKPVMGGGF